MLRVHQKNSSYQSSFKKFVCLDDDFYLMKKKLPSWVFLNMGLTKTFGCYTVWTGACLSVIELLLSFCAALGFGLEKFWIGLAIAVVAVVFLFVELYGLSAQKFGIIVAIGIFRFLGALASLVGK